MSNILIGVTSGIAVYKIPYLCRKFILDGHSVKVIMTENATKFVTPLTFESLTRNRVYIDDYETGAEPGSIDHIDLGKWADVMIIAPATANTVAKFAHGIADNLLSSTYLAFEKGKPVFIAPAMNTNMYLNEATRQNIDILKNRGAQIIDPVEGELACGDSGVGKMREPEEIFETVVSALQKTSFLSGLKVIVTAGPTVEDIDPVRFISNRSSGKMGFAIGETAQKMGAEVLMISGPVSIRTDLKTIFVRSASEMLETLKKHILQYDVLVMAAAVADYAVEEYVSTKIKKKSEELVLRLKKNPDILSELSRIKRKEQIFIGFAAESDNLEKNALDKLERKNLDFIVANDISRNDIGFNSEYNEVTIFFRDGTKENIPKCSKNKIAEIVLSKLKK